MKRPVLALAALLVLPAALAASQFVQLPKLPSTATISWSPAWGDYDNDGDLDLVVANGLAGSMQTLDLYRNRGDGTFEHLTADQVGSVASDLASWGVATWGDLDNDGFLDLVATSADWGGGTFRTPAFFRNQRHGTFQRVAAGDLLAAPRGFYPMRPFDLNGDGLLDLLGVADLTSASHQLYFNRGDGSFRVDTEDPITRVPVQSNADFWADIDDDGDIDVFVSNLDTAAGRHDWLFLNDGTGHLVGVTNLAFLQTPGWTAHGAWGDYDQDGDFDCILIKPGKPLLFRNDAGTFVPADIGLPPTAGGATWVDYDNDAYLDLFIERGQDAARTNSLLRNLGNGTFADVVDLITTNRVRRQGSAWADIDNDGDLDLVEVSPTGGTRLFGNLGNQNHWLRLILKGTASSADGAGSLVRVRATVGGKSVLQMQQAGGGGVAQVDPRCHFGLGDATQADEIVIRWPSGNTQVLKDVAADQTLQVTELAGITPSHPVATVNGNATMRATVLATGRQWYFAGLPLLGGTNASLSLSNVQPAQAGRYTVVSQTDAGPRTNHVYLRVLEQFTKILEGELVTESYGSQGPNWFDYDNDGNLDLYLGNSATADHDSLFHNDGNGRLTKVTDSVVTRDTPGSPGAAVADVNNDGLLDLLVLRLASSTTNTVISYLYLNNGQGNFGSVSSPPLTTPFLGGISASWTDYDADGRLDLFLGRGYLFYNQRFDDILYRGLADGSFATVSTSEAGSLVKDGLPTWNGLWFDCDNDGAQDLLVIHGGVLPRLHHNNHDGTFTRITGGSLTIAGGDNSAAVGDYDNDGLLDVFVTRDTLGMTALHRNLGGGVFSNVTAAAGIPAPGGEVPGGSWCDYDNDGYLDLLVTTYTTNAVYRNRGDGTFQGVDVGNLGTDGERTVVAAWADYDNNGFADLLLSCGDAGPRLNHLYRNGGNSNHWLKVKLVGTASNRAALGAKVRVRSTIGGRTFWQTREISGNPASGGMPLLFPHFGLGNATRAATVRIEWPSGTVQELGNVSADQVLHITEPAPWKLAAYATADGIRIDALGPANESAELQYSGRLGPWTYQATLTTDSLGAASVTIPAPTSPGEARFYRVRKP